MKNAICIVSKEPARQWMEFLKDFVHYDVYIVFHHGNPETVEDFKEKYPTIHFVTFSEEECIQNGFQNSSHMENSSLNFGRVIAWDKALYLFSKIETGYDHVWFLEDDVFFCGETTVANLDQEYPDADILCPNKNPEPKEGEWAWFWPAIHIPFPGPYFHSMICSVRLSRALLSHINTYVQRYGTLFFIEAMFPTMASHHGLQYTICDKLKSYWRKEWAEDEINNTDICHPVKDLEKQAKFRAVYKDRIHK